MVQVSGSQIFENRDQLQIMPWMIANIGLFVCLMFISLETKK